LATAGVAFSDERKVPRPRTGSRGDDRGGRAGRPDNRIIERMRATGADEARRAVPAAGAPARDVMLAALALAALSGLALAAVFDPAAAYRSLSEWLLARPAATFARNVHYWAAQVFVAAALLHAWARLRDARAAWRIGAGLAVAATLMLSGFVLRGDADAAEVVRILTLLAAAIPFVEPNSVAAPAATAYAVHVAAAVLVSTFLAVELLRRRGPRRKIAITVVVLVATLALFLSPGLHDGVDPRQEGPWYFVGLQRIVEWGAAPGAIAAAAAAAVALLVALAWLPAAWRMRGRALIGLAAAAYVAACGAGQLLRGDDGQPRWRAARGDLQAGWIFGGADEAPTTAAVAVRGRAEGCLACHAGIAGLGDSHAPERVGCASCHGGDPFTLRAERAHAGLVRVPGNLADARLTCGQAGCHVAIAPRVERSIMSTMAGVVAVNRRVIGVARGETAPVEAEGELPHAERLGHTAADHHLRELCVSCHLGQPKEEWGPIGEESRGGGCNACHLVYGRQAAADLARYLALPAAERTATPRSHPSLTVDPGNGHCFGCHSRSSRISTSYEGWHELRGDPPAGIEPARLRRLDDGRHFERVTADVHHERGLDCIDCHTSNEVMGSGVPVARKTDQLRVGCADCHAASLASIDTAALDPESRTLLALRRWTLAPGQRIGATRGGEPLVNVVVDADGSGRLRRKRSGEWLPLKAPLAACTEGRGHARLSCVSCHSAWAPRCTTCHTSFDPGEEGFDHVDRKWVQGTWNESSGPFEVAPPTLGIRTHRAAGGGEHGVVETFVPGMILTFDRNRDPEQPPDAIFRRLYGLTFAHTVRREARACTSCHNDPVALGYGRGALRYEVGGDGGRWRFAPGEPPSPHDGLPADAWIGFLQPRQGMVSTRDDVRPFTVDEQRRILRVGACLTCHVGESTVMHRALADFEGTLAARSRRCVLPVWP
jgi:hypothetical protein